MKDPEPDSPFAVCAEPKLSAAQYLRLRSEAEARAWTEQVTLWASLLLGCSVLAAVGSGISSGPGVLLWAVPMALGCGVLGLVAGLAVGWLSWVALGFRVRQSDPSRVVPEPGVWGAGAVCAAFWAGIGIILGTASGAAQADGALPYAVSASTFGAVAAFFTWMVWTRRRRKR